MTSSIPENLEKVRHRISHYAREYGRDEGAVELIAVSKTHGVDMIGQAFEAGQRHFGESYLQEAVNKILVLQDLPITWHFIGPIQSNKTRAVAEHFQWVHSVDRMKVARRLNDQRPDALAPLKVLLQVNISGEDSKSGVALSDLASLAAEVSALPRLVLAGLMAIPAPETDVARQRQAFARLRQARDDLVAQGFGQCRHLSMGMSGDFEAAIAEGATLVRIGTDIFGPREVRS